MTPLCGELLQICPSQTSICISKITSSSFFLTRTPLRQPSGGISSRNILVDADTFCNREISQLTEGISGKCINSNLKLFQNPSLPSCETGKRLFLLPVSKGNPNTKLSKTSSLAISILLQPWFRSRNCILLRSPICSWNITFMCMIFLLLSSLLLTHCSA